MKLHELKIGSIIEVNDFMLLNKGSLLMLISRKDSSYGGVYVYTFLSSTKLFAHSIARRSSYGYNHMNRHWIPISV